MPSPPDWFKHGRSVTYHYDGGHGDYEGWLDIRGGSKHPWWFICPAKGREVGWEEKLDDTTYHMLEKKKEKKEQLGMIEVKKKRTLKKMKEVMGGESAFGEGTQVSRLELDDTITEGAVVQVLKEGGSTSDFVDDDEFDDDADCTYVIEWNDGSTSELGEEGVKKAAALAKEEERRLTKLSQKKRRLEEKLDREKERETKAMRKRDKERESILGSDDDDDSIEFRSSSTSKNQKKIVMPTLSITNEKVRMNNKKLRLIPPLQLNR